MTWTTEGTASDIFMKLPEYASHWPDTWKFSHSFDQIEIGSCSPRSGYAYSYRCRQRSTLDLIEKVAGPHKVRILDVAAAQGNFSLTLAELGHDVTWNDLRADLVDYVKLKHTHGKITFQPGNVFDIQITSPFDIVLFTEIIEHVAHPDQFLKKLSALVKPGGHLVMSTPNGAYFRNNLPRFSQCPDPSIYEAGQFKPDSDGHIFLLWPEEIASLANQAGLEVVEHRVFTNPLTAGHVKLSHLLRILPSSLVWKLEKLSQRLPDSLRTRFCSASATLFRKP